VSTTEYIRYPTLGSGGGSGVVIYPTFASFPATAPTGTLAVAADSGILYEFIGGNWVAIAAPGDALSVGIPANGLSITMNVLSLQLASATSIGALSASDWSTFNSKQPAGNYITGLTGDGTATGPGTVPLTLATVNGNVGTFGSSTSIPSFTVNGKGLITSASGNPVIAPAGTLTGSTLAGNVLSSSLTSVGTISSGVWQGSPIQPSYVATLNQNTTGTAGNITASSNSTLVTLSSLSLPYSQLTGTPAPLVFSDSLVNTSGTVTLVNDSVSPTASQYYGTNGSSTLGYYNLPTGFTNPMTTAGDIIYENATPAPARLGIGTTGQVLTVVSGLPSWSTLPTGGTVTSVSLSAPSIFTVSGSPVTTSGTLALSYSGTALPVANGGTGVTSFTIDQVLLGGATTTGPLAQVPGGTLGYVLTSNGTTAAPTWQANAASSYKAPTQQIFTSGSGTYTLPTSPSPLYIQVLMVGGGGGGANTASGTGGTGGTTSFGTSLLTANGGTGGASASGAGGTGGTASLGSGPLGTALKGGSGGGGAGSAANSDLPGGMGGATPLGGAGGGGNGGSGAAGQPAVANSGSGGGGDGSGLPGNSAGGGGAGGYILAQINTPASTYPYVVGAAGAAGSSLNTGGSGYIQVTEYYQ
jgi:hypothetical protein